MNTTSFQGVTETTLWLAMLVFNKFLTSSQNIRINIRYKAPSYTLAQHRAVTYNALLLMKALKY